MSIDVSQFHQTFFEESFEGLDIMESGLLELDDRTDPETINAIFRAAHSIKGGSATFGFNEVATFTHAMETLLDEMRDGRRTADRATVDVLLKAVDCLRETIAALRDGKTADMEQAREIQAQMETLLGQATAVQDVSATPVQNGDGVKGQPQTWEIVFKPRAHLLQTGNDPARLIRELEQLGALKVQVNDSALPPLDQMEPERCYLSWRMRLGGSVDEAAIREIFEWVEDDCELDIHPLTPQPAAAERKSEARKEYTGGKPASDGTAAQPRKTAAKDSGSIRVSIDKIDHLINMVGELVITQSMMGNLDGGFEDFDVNRLEKLREGLALLERNTRELQESVMRIRMLPISFVFSRFPRMVHDLSQQLGKKVHLEMSGEQTELDKTVMEKIGDPLVHLIRNSIDHGIEPPEARLAAGKPEAGTVLLHAYHKGGNIVIEISDDGAGFDRDKILRKAKEKGLVEEEAQLPDDKIYELIFQPGFSTADTVSDVSGRGVGMDVVRRNIRELGGNVEVNSRHGQGTTFSIRLPLTLAILDGQLVKIGDETFIIPLVSIVESLQIKPEYVNSIAGRPQLYKLRDEFIPILCSHRIFNLGSAPRSLSNGLLVVIEGSGHKAALYVDELLGQQQVVIKSLETNFQRVAGISGATILGDGTVAMILDVEGLVHLARQQGEIDESKSIRAVA